MIITYIYYKRKKVIFLINIKKAERNDIPLIISLIKGLAEYEKLNHGLDVNALELEKEIFDEKNAEVVIAFFNEIPVGFALYFYNFSTFKGKKGLYLEDLYVLEKYRGKGVGNKLFQYLVALAKANHCGRMEWVCLDWNQPAIDFYKKKNAKPISDWTIFRIDESDF